MKDLKFKLYFPLTKEMTEAKHPLEFIQEYTGKEAILKEAIWLQYTGLKDALCNEIYDGDKVRFNGIGDSKSFCSVVRWEYNEWIAPKKDEDWKDVLHYTNECIEVTGNIHEPNHLVK